MNLEEIIEKAYHNYCLYCDMLEYHLYLFYEFFKILYKKQDNIEEIPPEALTKLTFE